MERERKTSERAEKNEGRLGKRTSLSSFFSRSFARAPLSERLEQARFMAMWKKQILARLTDSKKKIGVATHFSELIKLKLGKKLPYILCILTLY